MVALACRVCVLTSVLEDASVVGAVRAGAIGYLLKDTKAHELRQAIEALSEREVDVLRLLARGLANKELARDLGIAEKTVKTHVSSILGKLGVQSRTQAALYAGRIGLVPLDQLGGAETFDVDQTQARSTAVNLPTTA
jgi:DNA-binding NarL/FixJ family response regulator